MGNKASLQSVAVGTPVSIFDVRGLSSVGIYPGGGGGTMTCQVRVADGAPLVDIDPAVPTYSAAAVKAVLGRVFEVKFTATTADGQMAINSPVE